MGRRKSLIKLPFLKLKINKRTIFSIIGLFLVTSSIIILLSFFNLLSPDQGGRMLTKINQLITEKFGVMAFAVPFILLFISGHFFNHKKLKIVKLNVTVGLLLLFISLLGLFRFGEWGDTVGENLTLDFTGLGAFLILTSSFVIGLILFLNTSVDVFLLFIAKSVSSAFKFFKNNLFKEEKSSKKNLAKADQNNEEVFIKDKAILSKPKPAVSPPTPTPANQNISIDKELVMRSLSQTTSSTWVYPPLSLLHEMPQKGAERGDVNKNADVIEKTLDSFGIRARVSEVNYGPTVTQYALEITMGTKLSKITALSNDLALALAAPTGQVRIEAPIPGRSLVGIEIPNIKPQIVTIKQLLGSSTFTESTDPLLVPLGLDVSGKPMAATIEKMPHVLIAGTTGSGKSVLLNAWIATILFRTKPEDVNLIMVDPKRVELTTYNGIPHLLTEVIVEPEKIISALKWTVAEMESRYKLFSQAGARNIEVYNAKEGVEKKPYILFVIDELADLMMFAPRDAEDLITRIAQMSRATGIHLILATQRPSVDVITGLMKANIPTRLAFNVSSLIDSRVIIDTPGAEKLLGKGDMLYLPPDQAKPRRIQGPYITDKEVNELVKFLRSQVPVVHYTEEITDSLANSSIGVLMPGSVASDGNNDALFRDAVALITQFDKASASLIQRKFKVGYARAARILDELEQDGYVGPSEGSKPREVLKRPVEDLEI
ncbi:MAG: DNA translocase FtsK [Candidatus Roizmanbacteria bacterium]|nr:MAG: DNA translocase FtsK [Candidatus Roizmanbacteria bacterium]